MNHRRRHTRYTFAAPLLGLMVLAGCTTGGEASEPGDPSSARPSLTPIPTDAPPSEGILPADLTAAIVADAVALTGIAETEVRIVSAEATTWNDGALGCPQPGLSYTQALVDGYRVLVIAGEVELDYRTGSGGSFMRCEGFEPGG